MKKYLSILLIAFVLILMFALVSCDGKDSENAKTTASETQVTTHPEEKPVEPPVDVHEHSYAKTITEPSCANQGYTTYTCECGDSYVDNYVDPTGHTFGDWTIVIEATATKEGLEERSCKCGEKETRPISKKISEGMSFALNDDKVSYSIIGIGSCTDKEIIIPSTYEGLPVTGIGEKAFYFCHLLTSIRIPDSVTSIGNQAFFKCLSLTNIEVNENNQYYRSIDGNLYTQDGTKLVQYAIGKKDSSFTIPNSVKVISNYAFYGCNKLTSISISDTVIDIENHAFASCQSLTSLVIPDSVKSIGYDAFSGCKSLVSVIIGDSVTSVGNFAFRYCSSLVTLELGDSLESVGTYAFDECTSLTSVTMGASVKKIDYRGFSYCTLLTNIQFGGSIAQWNDIDKGTIWSAETGNYTIYCTDGTIAKDGTVTYN